MISAARNKYENIYEKYTGAILSSPKIATIFITESLNTKNKNRSSVIFVKVSVSTCEPIVVTTEICERMEFSYLHYYVRIQWSRSFCERSVVSFSIYDTNVYANLTYTTPFISPDYFFNMYIVILSQLIYIFVGNFM